MDRNEFLANFADQFDDIDPSEITFETRFRDLDEWGSLKGLLIMAMVSDEYGKELKADDIRKSNTVEDIFNIVNAL